MALSVAVALGLGNCASAQMSAAGSYRGQVLDMDTGKSLAGVLVVVVWDRDVYSPITKRITNEFHAAIEVHTDANGRFEVSAAPERAPGPSVVHVGSPAPIFFAPGYRLYRLEAPDDPLREPMFVYMKRVHNPRDAVELMLVPTFPYRQTPLLLKALNEERARLGLPPIQPGKEGKGDE